MYSPVIKAVVIRTREAATLSWILFHVNIISLFFDSFNDKTGNPRLSLHLEHKTCGVSSKELFRSFNDTPHVQTAHLATIFTIEVKTDPS